MPERLVIPHNPNQLISPELMQEKCGIVGISLPHDSAAEMTRNALIALQHRGMDSAGITVLNGEMRTFTGKGLIPQALPDKLIEEAGHSTIAIAHNRYATSGSITGENTQPVQVEKGAYKLSLAHNGNLTNTEWFRTELSADPNYSDTVLLTQYLLLQRPQYSNWTETFQGELPKAKGAFSLVAMTEDGNLYGMRDPHGIRPFVIGSFQDRGIILASETVALDAVEADYRRQVERGEILTITQDGTITSTFFGMPQPESFCTFENFYFSRPESYVNETRVQEGRIATGRILARKMNEKGIQADGVVPIRDSGYFAAQGFAEESRLKTINAVGTSHYVGRSFILNGQKNRSDAVHGKHTIIPDMIDGVDLAVVDDSVVRGTTMRKLGKGLVEAGAGKINVFSASPPIVDKCDLGVDMKEKKELPATEAPEPTLQSIEEYMAKLSEVDSMTFLTTEETAQAFGRDVSEMCTFCLGGSHPVHDGKEQFRRKERERPSETKISIVTSGESTTLSTVLDSIESENLSAIAIPFELGNDNLAEAEHDQALTEHLESMEPTVMLLDERAKVSGTVLQKAREMEIPVLKFSPSLISRKEEPHVATSRGLIPTICEEDAIREAYDRRLRVSGVSVYQVLPSTSTETVRPIILKEEVRRISGEAYESWQKRMLAAEQRVLPAALNRVLHVINHDIDVSTGEFPW